MSKKKTTKVSKAYELKKEDWSRILVGAGVAMSGALVTYFSEVVVEIDWGHWTPLVVAGFSVLANVVRKWATDYTK
jgi:hypothetical protein